MVDFWVRPLHRWVLDPVVWFLFDLAAMLLADSMRTGNEEPLKRCARYLLLATSLADRSQKDFPLDVAKWLKLNDRLRSKDIVQ